jgi:hypothetical protein
MKLENGMLTIGSSWSKFGLQLYWPQCNLEWVRNMTTREKIAPGGFCVRFSSTMRVVVNPVERHFAFALQVLGFGFGIQYLKP